MGGGPNSGGVPIFTGVPILGELGPPANKSANVSMLWHAKGLGLSGHMHIYIYILYIYIYLYIHIYIYIYVDP